jgi:hypothetical protein
MGYSVRKFSTVIVFVLLSGLLPLSARSQGIDQEVDSLIRKSCSAIAGADRLSFSADITIDEMTEGGVATRRGRVDTAIRRPDGVQTVYSGETGNRSFWYDGDQVTVMEPGSGFYASEVAPGTVDEALDFVNSRLGFSLPLEDFYYSDPYDALLSGVTKGTYVGKEPVGGIPCHRLALVQDDIDWEIWIEDSDLPVPRKLSITYKNLPGKPRYSAVINDWNFTPDLSRRFFIFEPPLGAERIGVLPGGTHGKPEGGAE